MNQKTELKTYYSIQFMELFLDEISERKFFAGDIWQNFDNPPAPLPPGIVYYEGMEVEVVSDKICDPLEIEWIRRELSGNVQVVFYPKVTKQTYLDMKVELKRLGYKQLI